MGRTESAARVGLCSAMLGPLLAIVLSLAFGTASAAQTTIADRISSKRFIVIDPDTGELFAEQASHDKVAIASLTKIFTAIEAIERAPLNHVITTDSSDLFDANSTTMGFGPGESFTLQELLYGMMLPSGNDAAHAIARSLGALPDDTDPEQSVERFVGWMNERVTRMGLTETHLTNPHGLGVPDHYSSAHDVAAYMRYALRYPIFVAVIGTSSYTTSSGYTVSNTNRLLNSDPEVIGGKTGYDDDSGYCLVEVAVREDDRMVAVTLDGVAPDVWYQDNSILLDYGFRQKSDRVARGAPMVNASVTFRDPDAALIQSFATPGAVLGQTAIVPTVPPGDTAPTPVSSSASAAPESSSSGRSYGFLAAIVVAAIVVVAGVIATQVLGKKSRQPAP